MTEPLSLRLFLTCLIALPALYGVFLPRALRWLFLVASAAIACALLATGINVHDASVLIFMLTAGNAGGMLVVELATELARFFEPSQHQPDRQWVGGASE